MAIDQATKAEWLEKFQGATLSLNPTFGSPKVNHMFRRNFDQMGRNAFFISVRGRILLGEDQISAAEQMIYDRITEITKTIERKTEATKAILADAAITKMASYNRPEDHEAVIVSPMQTKYVRLLEAADELFKNINTLMLYGEISEREHSKRELEIKQHMRVVPSVIRKVTIGLRTRLDEASAKQAGQVSTETTDAAEASEVAEAAELTPAASPAVSNVVETPEVIAQAA